jgi:hypothetical protein
VRARVGAEEVRKWPDQDEEGEYQHCSDHRFTSYFYKRSAGAEASRPGGAPVQNPS